MMLDHLSVGDEKVFAAASWHAFTSRTFSRRLREDFEDFARGNAVVLLLVVDLVDHAEQPAVAAIQRAFQRFLKNCERFRPWQPKIPRWEGLVHLKTVGRYVFAVAAKSGVFCSPSALPAAALDASFVEQILAKLPKGSTSSAPST